MTGIKMRKEKQDNSLNRASNTDSKQSFEEFANNFYYHLKRSRKRAKIPRSNFFLGEWISTEEKGRIFLGTETLSSKYQSLETFPPLSEQRRKGGGGRRKQRRRKGKKNSMNEYKIICRRNSLIHGIRDSHRDSHCSKLHSLPREPGPSGLRNMNPKERKGRVKAVRVPVIAEEDSARRRFIRKIRGKWHVSPVVRTV